MSVSVFDPNENEKRIKMASLLVNYFDFHKKVIVPKTSLAMHEELFAYYPKEQMMEWLKQVGQNIFEDILLGRKKFRVGSLGSIWFDASYTSAKNVTHNARVALTGNFDESMVDWETFDYKEYDGKLKFIFLVDIL